MALHDIVYRDAEAAHEDWRANDSARTRRVYVRTAFAAIEALTYMLKREALTRPDLTPGIYSPAELAVLREETYAVDSRGRAYSSSKFIPLAENFRFTIEMFMRGAVKEFTFDAGGRGWAAFKRAVALRHRITHPKSASDMAVSDEEMATVHYAFFWVNQTVISALQRAAEEMSAMLGREPTPTVKSIRQSWLALAKFFERDA